jgi:hypothetical protein
MSTNGRPPVLNETKKSQIIALLKSGCGKLTAAAAVNCHPQTIANTARRDPEFAKKLALADNAAQLVHLENVNKAATDVKYWRASAWVLERLNPDRFGKSTPDAVTPPQLAAVIFQIAEAIVEEIPVAAFRTRVLKRFDRILKEACLPGMAMSVPSQDCSQLESPATTQ